MTHNDFERFATLWGAAWDQAGAKITATAIELAFEALVDYEVSQIQRALSLHMRDPDRGRFAPKVADVVGILQPVDSALWPNADEAWALCVRSFDESDTVVICDEIMQAREICQPVMDIGDEIGARVAFRDAYNRTIACSKLQGKKPRWWISQGHNREMREMRITEAVRQGRLHRSQAMTLLGYDPTVSDVRFICDERSRNDGPVQIGMIGKPVDTPQDREEKRRVAESRRQAVIDRASEAMRRGR